MEKKYIYIPKQRYKQLLCQQGTLLCKNVPLVFAFAFLSCSLELSSFYVPSFFYSQMQDFFSLQFITYLEGTCHGHVTARWQARWRSWILHLLMHGFQGLTTSPQLDIRGLFTLGHLPSIHVQYTFSGATIVFKKKILLLKLSIVVGDSSIMRLILCIYV